MWIYNYAGVQRGKFTALHLMRTAERAQRSPVVILQGLVMLQVNHHSNGEPSSLPLGWLGLHDVELVLESGLGPLGHLDEGQKDVKKGTQHIEQEKNDVF